MNKKKLEYYGGDGFGGLKENGSYTVKYQDKERGFNSLKAARLFYDSLVEPKAFWSGIELIDAWQ